MALQINLKRVSIQLSKMIFFLFSFEINFFVVIFIKLLLLLIYLPSKAKSSQNY